MKLLKRLVTTSLAILLSACGGSTGFPPVITGVKVGSLMYGHNATIYLGGKDLRSTIKIESNSGCTKPSFASNSNTDLLILNCGVLAVGEFPLVIKSEAGSVLYSTTLNVPKPEVTLFTTLGSIVVELDPSIAPISSNNFLAYVSKSFYTSTLFHRVIAGFVVQGGGYTEGLTRKLALYEPIELETNKGLFNLRGTLAMARTNTPNSATSEFFINLVDNALLDYKSPTNPGYAVFGKVVQGLDVVDAIGATPTVTIDNTADVPISDITIQLAIQTK
jgi:cyclophilin family peptidyl-prolyl cis-trans isomerase